MPFESIISANKYSSPKEDNIKTYKDNRKCVICGHQPLSVYNPSYHCLNDNCSSAYCDIECQLWECQYRLKNNLSLQYGRKRRKPKTAYVKKDLHLEEKKLRQEIKTLSRKLNLPVIYT